VLVLLLLHANEVVSADRLTDELWGDDPPQDAPAALQAHVSRLRKLLEPERDGQPRVIRTVPPGYLIEVRDDEVDLLRFQGMVAGARARLDGGDAAGAAATLREAFALWRGRPLADLENEPLARDPIRELDEMWLEAVELRIDADLATGRHADLVRELTALARRYPLREHIRRQLMLALYRSGRQAEALEAYAELRRKLVEDLGLEPSRELRALQEAMLRQDPELDLRRPGAVRVVPRRRRRLGLALLAVALAALAAVGLFALLGSEETRDAPRADGLVVAVSPRSGEVQARVAVGATPSAVAVGEGRVWVVNADDQTISRIDPRSRASDTFAIGATPTDLAVGGGAVWVGSGGSVPRGQSRGLVTTALARVDPGSRAPRATIRLPAAGTAVASNAVSDHIAVTPRAVWAIGPDERVRRVDPRANRITATIAGVRARAIAADRNSVWILAGDGAVTRIDERTNEVLARGKVSASSVASIAAGAGSAWISAPDDGTVWRAVPGRGDRLVMDTVRVPIGMTDTAYGAGSLWGVNPLRGTLTQIDARGGSIVRTIPIGGFPRGVAVGPEAVWVATAPAAGDAPAASQATAGVTPLPASFCERPFYGGREPANRLVVSDLPLQGGLRLSSQQMADAMAFVLRQHGFRAGRWRVAFQSCDDAVAATRLPDDTKCAANARTYGRTPGVITVLGPLNSGCALAAVPELGRAPGPLAIVSPLTSYSGLTRAGPGTPPGELRTLYPSGRRNFLRVYPADDHQVAALAQLAKRLGRAPVYVLDDGDDEYGRLFADQFEHSAEALGLPIAARASWEPGAQEYRRLAARVARSRPQAVFVGGQPDTGGVAVVKALRDQLGDRVALLMPSAFSPSLLVQQAGSAGGGVFVALSGIAAADQLPREGRRFAKTFGATLAGEALEPSAIYSAQAMEVVLDAIRRSDGTRASVLGALFETRIPNGLLGPVGFDRNGDIETSPVTILRVEPGARTHPLFPDAVVDRVLRVPVRLLQ
jgi:DNA-binding SARP family transcriptional activator/ABC-type branched-subunit amino acid transport system substrate-binding protein